MTPAKLAESYINGQHEFVAKQLLRGTKGAVAVRVLQVYLYLLKDLNNEREAEAFQIWIENSRYINK